MDDNRRHGLNVKFEGSSMGRIGNIERMIRLLNNRFTKP